MHVKATVRSVGLRKLRPTPALSIAASLSQCLEQKAGRKGQGHRRKALRGCVSEIMGNELESHTESLKRSLDNGRMYFKINHMEVCGKGILTFFD